MRTGSRVITAGFARNVHFVGGVKSEDVDSSAYVPTIFEDSDVSLKRKAVQGMETYNTAKKRRLVC